MLRGGMRYLCVGKGRTRCGLGFETGGCCTRARSLSPLMLHMSSNRSNLVLSSFYSRVSTAAASRHFPPLSPFSNFRLWSSGRTSQELKDSMRLMEKEACSSSPQAQSGEENEKGFKQLMEVSEQQAKQSWRQRAKNFAIEYGRVGICTHIVLSLVSFSIIYVGVSSGLDVSAFLDSVGLSIPASDSTTNSAGSLLIAYAIYKILAPVRWPLTLAITPVVLRLLRRRGYMLAPTDLPSNRSPPPLP